MGLIPPSDPGRKRSPSALGAMKRSRALDHGQGPVTRFEATVLAAGCSIGLLAVLLPHPASYNETALMTLQIGGIASSVIVYLFADRAPKVFVSLIPAIATVLVSAGVFMTGDSASAFVYFYLWSGLALLYFMPMRLSVVYGGFTAANFILVSVLVGPNPPPDPGYADTIIGIGSLAGGTVLFLFMRIRAENLIERLSAAATTDMATNRLNRRGIIDALAHDLREAQATGAPVGVIVFDLDQFQRVNDAYGLGGGDRIVVEVADILDGFSGPLDRVGRTGTKEFTIIASGAGEADTHLLASELIARVRASFKDARVPITASVGIASSGSVAGGAEEIIAAAERAKNTAKAFGRDRIVVHSTKVDEISEKIHAQRSSSSHSQLATVLGLAEALDLREGSTARHSEVVAHYCEMTARQLGFDVDHVERVRLAGMLHDIGKIAIPDSVLCKPDKLTDEEYELMKRHPELGARMLAASEFADIREWVLSHHERPDGRGYPRGLSGDEIPIEGRILAVADAYEAMTADRVYRKAPGLEFAREELHRCTGTQFDPDVVAGLLHVIDLEAGAPVTRPFANAGSSLGEIAKRGVEAASGAVGVPAPLRSPAMAIQPADPTKRDR